MKAIIPAAGYATRLYPLTKDKPKALLEIAGKPMLERVIEKILEIPAVDSICIVTNSKFAGNFEKWAKGFRCRIPIKVLNDGTASNEDRLGAIGDINFVLEKEKIDDDVIIVASDNLFNFSLRLIYGSFLDKKAAMIAVYDVKSVDEARKMGVVTADADGKITDFVEKPENPSSTNVSTAVYLYPKPSVRLIRKYLAEGNSPDKTGEFVAWLYRQEDVYAFAFNKPGDRWYDIGTLDMLENVRKEYERKGKARKVGK